MKKLLIISFLSGAMMQGFSQGKLQLSPGTNLTTSNGAQIILEDTDLDNDGNIDQQPGDGSFIFTGNLANQLSGKGITRLDKLVLSKPGSATLFLKTNLSVIGRIKFEEGKLNLTDHNIYLGNTGELESESETSHLFSTGKGFIESVHEQYNASSINPGNLGVIFSSASNPGKLTVRRGHVSQQNILTGNESILRYYDVLPANNTNINATLRFRYFDGESNNINEADLIVLRGTGNNNWKELGADMKSSSANFVEKKGVTELSRFTLSTASENKRESLGIWPNPVISSATIGINSLSAANLKIQIYNSKGALVQVQDNRIGAGINQVKVNMQKLPQGNYTIHTNLDGKTKITAISKM